MRVLLISTSDIEGGAARAAFRLHRGLIKTGVDSNMLVLSKKSDDPKVKLLSSKWYQAMNRLNLPEKPEQWISKYYLDGSLIPFSHGFLSSKRILKDIENINPDVVHLHWFHNGFMSTNLLRKINRPIIWSMHDMWAFTGGCHYDSGCGRFTDSCGKCPILESDKENDISRKGHRRKLKAYDKTENLTIIGLSQWLAESARSSTLLRNKKVLNLPNCIDTETYKPINKEFARTALNLPQDKKLILFGAMNSTSDKRKGYQYLKETIRILAKRGDHKDTELLVFGASQPKNGEEPLPMKSHFTGRIYDDTTLALLYSAADVMVAPSLQENLGNTIMEALACGTPVVGFRIGGNPDMVSHKENGFLADPFGVDLMADGVTWVLEDPERHARLSEAARKKVLDCFSEEVVCTQYIDLYNQLKSGASIADGAQERSSNVAQQKSRKASK